MAKAATRASADPQIECCSQPRNSGSVPTILPKGEPGSETEAEVWASAEMLSDDVLCQMINRIETKSEAT